MLYKNFPHLIFPIKLTLICYSLVLADELKEYKLIPKGDKKVSYEITTVYPETTNRLWLETEGVHNYGNGKGEVERLDIFYGFHFHKHWDFRLGYGFKGSYGYGKKDRRMLILGIKGLDVYKFEFDFNIRKTTKGEYYSDFEFEYNISINEKFVLQPRITTSFANKRIEDIEIGKGFNDITFLVIFFYKYNEKIAPYIMVSQKYLIGDRKNMAQDEGKKTSITDFSFGVRFRF